MPVHITLYGVWCFEMQSIYGALSLGDGAKQGGVGSGCETKIWVLPRIIFTPIINWGDILATPPNGNTHSRLQNVNIGADCVENSHLKFWTFWLFFFFHTAGGNLLLWLFNIVFIEKLRFFFILEFWFFSTFLHKFDFLISKTRLTTDIFLY